MALLAAFGLAGLLGAIAQRDDDSDAARQPRRQRCDGHHDRFVGAPTRSRQRRFGRPKTAQNRYSKENSLIRIKAMYPHSSALVVEDNPHMRVLLSQVLHELDVEHVDAVASLSEAREHMDFMAYDLALIDVGLGEENGIDFIREVRLNTEHPQRRLPMIVVTGQNVASVVIGARDAGADSFLTKPVSTGALKSRVAQVLRERRPLVESATYFGPDRRRRADPNYRGPERRGARLTFEID